MTERVAEQVRRLLHGQPGAKSCSPMPLTADSYLPPVGAAAARC